MRILYGISQSPWTERARWALEHHGLTYSYHEHVPMLGEVLLRMKARAAKASVPLLEDGDRIVMGSFAIAKHAESSGKGERLFPADQDDAIARWVDVAERMLNVGRAWATKRMSKSKEALAEGLPAFVPESLKGSLAPSAALALRFLHRKWDIPGDVDVAVETTLRPLLGEVRAALAAAPEAPGLRYVLGGATFSVADLVLASAMQVIRPHERAKTMGPSTFEVWTNPTLVRDFGDLLEWRDAIYANHRS